MARYQNFQESSLKVNEGVFVGHCSVYSQEMATSVLKHARLKMKDYHMEISETTQINLKLD